MRDKQSFDLFNFGLSEAESHFVAQASFELAIILLFLPPNARITCS